MSRLEELEEKLETQKQAGEAPEWLTAEAYKTLQKRMLKHETPKDAFVRVADRAADILSKPDLKDRLFDWTWNRVIGLATPVASNFGTDRGMPISCFTSYMADTLTHHSGIFPTAIEAAEMSRVGGGVGVSVDEIRPAGSYINGNGGESGGVVPWMRLLDVTFDIVSQATRRGSGSVSLDIEHPDWDDFIEARDNTGDPRKRVYDLHLSTRIKDSFMQRLFAGEQEAVRRWTKLIQYRWETGESYIEFDGHINGNLPQAYRDLGFFVKNTNICTEILQHTDKDHSVVCDLSSLNLAIYDLWSSEFEQVVTDIHLLLDAVMTEFIDKGSTSKYPFLIKAVNGAKKARALGIGVLGWHDLLFSRGLAFDNSPEVMKLNAEIFRSLRDVTNHTSKKLAVEYGEPEWLRGYGERNMFKTALAPTKSNSAVVGAIGEGIMPCVSNLYEKEGLEGSVIQINPYFVEVLEKYGKNDYKTRKTIARNKGSVQHLDFLTEHEKKMFKTAREIDQHKYVRQVAQRQQFIDQGQSVNLFFPANAKENYINSVHLTAYQLGLKTLYYLKSGAAIEGDALDEVCESCEG